MVGIGTWEFMVDMPMYRGKVLLHVNQKDGRYAFVGEIAGNAPLPLHFTEVQVQGAEVRGKITAKPLGNQSLPFQIAFDDVANTANGWVQAPFMGKIPLKNGKKIQKTGAQ